jgi:hypothetical protein
MVPGAKRPWLPPLDEDNQPEGVAGVWRGLAAISDGEAMCVADASLDVVEA